MWSAVKAATAAFEPAGMHARGVPGQWTSLRDAILTTKELLALLPP
jgi:hypothetical protein